MPPYPPSAMSPDLASHDRAASAVDCRVMRRHGQARRSLAACNARSVPVGWFEGLPSFAYHLAPFRESRMPPRRNTGWRATGAASFRSSTVAVSEFTATGTSDQSIKTVRLPLSGPCSPQFDPCRQPRPRSKSQTPCRSSRQCRPSCRALEHRRKRRRDRAKPCEAIPS